MKNRLAGLSDKELLALSDALRSDAVNQERNRLIDGPSEEERAAFNELNDFFWRRQTD